MTKISMYCWLLLALLVSASAFGQSTSRAVVYTSGVVLVNGRVAPATTVLFQGDTLQTTNGASAVIVSPGSSVSVPENSQAKYQAQGVQVIASANGTKGGALSANGYAMSPAGGNNASLTLVSPGMQTIIPITGICPNTVHCGFH